MNLRHCFFLVIIFPLAYPYSYVLGGESKMIGEIDLEKAGIRQDAGCYFGVPEKENSNVLVQEDAEWINLNGQNVKLVPVEGHDNNLPERGKKGTLLYRAGKINVEVNLTNTTNCEGEDCVVSSYEGLLSVSSGKEKQTIKISGGCGC